MRTVYVFGAGASHAYSQSPTQVRPPLARTFFEAYSQLQIAEDFEVRVGDIVNYVRDLYGVAPERFGTFKQDIEQFMTQLDLNLRELARQRAEGERSTEAWRRFLQANSAYDQTIFLIAHVLNEIQNGPTSFAYSKLVKQCGRGDTLITFNWDTLLDHALRESGLWNPDTGYMVPFESLLDGSWRKRRDDVRSELTLLKLHGSVNWLVNYVSRNLQTGDRQMLTSGTLPDRISVVAEPNLRRIRNGFSMTPEVRREDVVTVPVPKLSSPDAWPVCVVEASKPYPAYRNRYRPGYAPFSFFFPPNHPRTGVPTMPLVIPPTSFKLYEEFAHVTDPLWTAAAESLRLADRIVIAGYSFPTTDARPLRLFRGGLSGNDNKIVEVVDPNPSPIRDRLISDVGVPPTQVLATPRGFEQYAEQLSGGGR